MSPERVPLIEIEIDLKAMDLHGRKISGLVRKVKNLKPAWKLIAKAFWQLETQVFKSKGTVLGQQWAPLAASTIASKARQGYPPDILVRTGDLRSSLIAQTADSVLEIKNQQMKIGTSVPYAMKHQRGQGRLPARPFIGAPDAAIREWADIVRKHIAGGVT